MAALLGQRASRPLREGRSLLRPHPSLGGSRSRATAALGYTRRTLIVVVWARVPDWPPCETSVNVMFWFGVAPTNLFAVGMVRTAPASGLRLTLSVPVDSIPVFVRE